MLADENERPLAYWSRYGYATLCYATLDQLRAMLNVLEARSYFTLVMKTTHWIHNVEWRVQDMCEPFSDTCTTTKIIDGYKLLDFRENFWRHSTSVLMSLVVLTNENADVGIVDPSYHGFADTDQKWRVVAGYGAAHAIGGLINLGLHWVAFFIDKKDCQCRMFDPLQSDQNYKTIEKSMREGMEVVLSLEGKIEYERVDWCQQKR
ncbi:hypothetical protein PHMEG_00023378 [Phytophthora megakarya]|uniref:Ubiquitin-like protease family profile domain-containing protein n=1 Tax=Phytophthora megakarya TaxID=4795 RepID=A0A225VJI8_9STRA|nr:hypothetical protein PHMEG_00023378 [Phytophthora megakarya]